MKENSQYNVSWTPDESQLRVINATGGYHLVLAPPGCGKTQILTERIRKAHADGVEYGDMLCLTFTNRAARGMQDRIIQNIEDEGVGDVFVGNVHRFCSKMLFENNIVAAETSIIDDEDMVSIITRSTGEDEFSVMGNYRKMQEYNEIVFLSHFMYQIAHRHPRKLRIHQECVTSDDVVAMRAICRVQRMDFTSDAMIDIYNNPDYYRDACSGEGYDVGERKLIMQLMQKMNQALLYEKYKRENKLIDFEDLLLLAYDALTADSNIKRYSWIQVDEVQDLNPLQLELIDMMSAKEDLNTVMYLGDEQQAIFSFMGAKMSTLDLLKMRCKNNIHHLKYNHRSPKYLLDVFNRYAEDVLNIDNAFLPDTDFTPKTMGNELEIVQSGTLETEYLDAAMVADRLQKHYPEETTAVIVNSNRDAEAVSKALLNRNLKHFKVSGNDLFSSSQIKFLFAHLSVMNNENNFIAWAHILMGLHVFESSTAARNFTRQCMDKAMLPQDFLLYEDSSYVQDFAKTYSECEIVIFDTETTGLDVFSDDILQIAAVKIRNGKVVAGSELSLYIETDREIPEMLGDVMNPIIEERKHQKLLSHADALQRFVDYVGNGVLLGHNADYDYNILDYNCRRYLPAIDVHVRYPKYFDSLRLIRLLQPGLKQYKLKFLLEMLHLEGENSHLADADVNATRSLVDYCYAKAVEITACQREFMSQTRVKSRVEVLRRNYRELFLHSRNRLYVLPEKEQKQPALVDEMTYAYDYLVKAEVMLPLQSIDYITRYLSDDVIDEKEEPALITQLQNHIIEMNTLKEADLCGCSTMTEKIFVTTVHKAKGLEFDNVIVFDAIEGRYPNYYSQNNKAQLAEDARKFYVAMTRTKKRLIIMQSTVRPDYHGVPHPKPLTRFMNPLLKMFPIISLSHGQSK